MRLKMRASCLAALCLTLCCIAAAPGSRVSTASGSTSGVERDGPHAAAYRTVAENVVAALEAGAGSRPAPAIRFE